MHLFRSPRFLAPALLAAALLASTQTEAALTLPAVFGPGMVLQRGMPVPVWGTASAGDKLVVEFAGQQKKTEADAQGKWRVTLDPLESSALSQTLTVTATTGEKQVKAEFPDVLVGEVWVGSGQSNMAMNSGAYTNRDPVLAAQVAGSYPLLRLCGNASRGGWRSASTNHNLQFSALLFSFGLRLQQELGVPVGLMVGAVSGTASGFWLSNNAYQTDAGCKADVEKAVAAFDNTAYEALYAGQLAVWSQAVAQAKQAGKPVPGLPRNPLKPGEALPNIGVLYEAHIRPFQPYAIRGVLWDQGESGTAIAGVTQSTLMNALVHGWRREWGQGDFPFIVIQKPSGGGCAWNATDPITKEAEAFTACPGRVPDSGAYREEHLRIGQIPGVFLAVSSDLGRGTHPLCKSGYGARAARVALGAVYGRPGEITGPTYKSFTLENGKIRIQFDHVGQGLAVPANATAASNTIAVLQGFAVAGTNRVFQWAKATIEGGTVVVESDKVPQPVSVRYAWANNHPWANLFNKDGLPATTFRTDTW